MGADVRRGSLLSTLFIDFAKKTFGLNGWMILLVSFSLSACNNISKPKRSPAGDTFSITEGSGGGSQSFTLVTVLPSQKFPGTMYDLVGQDSEFENYCSNGIGTCNCEYTYTQGGGGQSQSVAAVDIEADMLRCQNMVPSGIATFDVRISVVDAGAAELYSSNSISVNLNQGAFTGATSYLNLSDEASYVQAKRFQCRKREFIANPMDSDIIDPFQSQDSRVVYPFNFYTTNLSQSIINLQRGTILNGNAQIQIDKDWECSLSPYYDLTGAAAVHWWANPTVFSSSTCTNNFCNGDQFMMYPQNDLVSKKIPVTVAASQTVNGKSRGSFWLASKAYGVFQIPIVAKNAPVGFTQGITATIGYGAKPIPNASGLSSSCPAITLPAKSKWVKLWNFRATNLTPPKKVVSSFSTVNSEIACHTVNAAWAFPSCTLGTASGMAAFGTSIDVLAAASDVASRVAIVNGGANACYNLPAMAGLVGGAETWRPGYYAFGQSTLPAPNPFPLATLQSLPWGLYAAASTTCNDAVDFYWRASDTTCSGGGSVGPPAAFLPAGTPQDTASIQSLPIVDDVNNPDNYSDNLFIVTDVNATGSFDNSMITSTPTEYSPLTYRSSSDCTGVDPYSTAVPGECLAQQRVNWEIETSEVQQPNNQNVYPLCVLQFWE